MPVKVKRGLGLLVVAVIGCLVLQVLVQIEPGGGAETVLLVGATVVSGLVFLGGLACGLVLLAWGLLRD